MELLKSSATSSCTKYTNDYRICRTCMSAKDLYPLFPQKENYRSFATVLHLSTGLNMEINDGLPQHICRKCAKRIESAMKFRASSQLTDKKLRSEIQENKRRAKDTIVNCKEALYTAQVKRENEEDIAGECDEAYFNGNKSDDSFEQQVCPKIALSSKNKSHWKSIKREMLYEKYLDRETFIDKGQRVTCKMCKRSYKTFSNFRVHVDKDHRDLKTLCEFCGLRFQNNPQRLRHLRARHNLARDNSFACTYCGYQALDKEMLQSHERRQHTKERPFVCDECGEAFYTRRVLKQHCTIHMTETPFQCNFCQKKFKLRSKMNHHISIVHYKKQRPYIFGCYICSHKFEQPYNVRKHLMRIHHIPKNQTQGKILKFCREEVQQTNSTEEQTEKPQECD